MSIGLTRFVLAYLFLLGVVCAIVHRELSLHEAPDGEIVASVWRDGVLVERAVVTSEPLIPTALRDAVEKGGDLAFEKVVADAPILMSPEIAFAIALVPGKDGVRATLEGKTAYVTPDDLMSAQLYDHGVQIPSLSIALGVDIHRLAQMLAERMGVWETDILERARWRRIRVERHTTYAGTPRITGDALNPDAVRAAIVGAAGYLARGVNEQGRYRYMVDAPTDKDMGGYDWPRHAGATYFLAQAARLTQDPALAEACRRAATLMRTRALVSCGNMSCVGDEPIVSLGSSALAVLAFSEIVESGLDESAKPALVSLTRFLREQQRPDGEFMHQYSRPGQHPIDVQGLYYSSEATLALARAYRITHDDADLGAAARGLAYLVGPAWKFFGDRYYFGEEHWTCQAMAALWPYSPDSQALDFCIHWQGFSRALQMREGDSYFDSDGAIGVGPVVTPRLTPVGSRCEAAVATLDVARQAGVSADELGVLERQLRRALALLLRQQFLPGPKHLFKNPEAVFGAMPGSEVDWQLRIDYAQHAGSAMVRWLELFGEPQPQPPPGNDQTPP
jgi:hypothetical protein